MPSDPQAATQQVFQEVISELRGKRKQEVTILLLGECPA